MIEGVLGEAQEGDCRSRGPSRSAQSREEAEAEADERSRQEGHVEADQGVLGEAEKSQGLAPERLEEFAPRSSAAGREVGSLIRNTGEWP